MEYNTDKDVEYEDAIESVDCSALYPGLRSVADKICSNRLRCGLHCRDCDANDTNYCTSANYWRYTPSDTIQNDMIKYFGESTVNKFIDEVKSEYGESIFKTKHINRDEQIIKAYLDDIKIKNIAKMFETNENEIYKIIRKYKSKYYSQRDLDIYNMYENGVSIEDIGKRYGVSNRAIYRILRLQGLSQNSKIITERNRDIYRDYQLGSPKKDIAEKYGLTERSVQNILKSIKLELQKDG